jgi:hypothetical protein
VVVVIKICTRCGLERDAEEDFRWGNRKQAIRAMRCKYCQSELSKLHYQNNKQSYKDRTRLRKTQLLSENKPRLQVYLSTHPCIDCGQIDIRVLEFDHVREQKSGEISDLLRQGHSWSTIETEIAKCEIRCANCHRIRTFENHDRNWRNIPYDLQQGKCYQQMYAYLSTHPCIDCKETDIRLLEFDHVRGHKTENISRLLAHGCNWTTIEAEIIKCEVRCANCHRIQTYERDGDWWLATNLRSE